MRYCGSLILVYVVNMILLCVVSLNVTGLIYNTVRDPQGRLGGCLLQVAILNVCLMSHSS